MNYVLGLDLGVASVGWAVVECDTSGKPLRVEKLGVRIFPSGTGTVSEIQQGSDASRNATRRQARLIRRNIWRRKRRVLKVFNILRNNNLLPSGKGIGDTPQDRTDLIQKLDQELLFQLKQTGIETDILPYTLRALALDKPLTAYQLGRIMLHLAQRRGFLSNKKTASKNDEEEGTVKKGISELAQAMQAKGCRTLGEYLSTVDSKTEQRIRQRWTGRKMFEYEFNVIWEAQARFAADTPNGISFTEELRAKLFKALFYQRPLKSQKDLIGKCDLEPAYRRAASASVEAQRFRYWQKILDLEYQEPDGFYRPLTSEEQDKLAGELEQNEKVTFSEMRKLFGIKRGEGKFNLETEGVNGIKGNTTSARLGKILGERWHNGDSATNDAIINEILMFENEDALARRLEKRFGFDSNTASQLAAVRLEDDHISMSKQAIQKILPVMIAKRQRLNAVRKEIYGDKFDEDKKEVMDFLPQVEKDKKHLDRPFFKDAVRNPVVIRALTETRKVVNALIRQYGKPLFVRIELARDMKKSRKERIDIDKKNRVNEKKRDAAKVRLLKEIGIQEPKRIDIEKMLLAEECNWECPYTGKTISMSSLFGPEPQFDIEHILPFSRSLDNSFINKTLCDVKENRDVKRNKIPWEAYGHDPNRWKAIMTRVSKFRSTFAPIKRRRFEMQEIPEGFLTRDLNDTRYISRLAGEYLGMLFGGKSDAGGTLRVQVSAGGMTAYLRGEWKLNEILGGSEVKNRADHRHHAVDAVVIACNETGTIQTLANAAERASDLGKHRLFIKGGLEEPFDGFKEQVDNAVNEINVSFRADNRVSGALHKETNYSPLRETTERIEPTGNKTGKNWERIESRHIRKPVASLLTEKQINDIVDPVIRNIVLQKWEQNGRKKWIEGGENDNLPWMTTKKGLHIPIKRVRVRDNTGTITLGKEKAAAGKGNERYVAAGGNHHIEVFYVLSPTGNITYDKNNNEVLDWKCVSSFESHQRLKNCQPVVALEDHYADSKDEKERKLKTRLKFSLSKGEYVVATPPNEEPVLLVVKKMSENAKGVMYCTLCPHYDSRTEKERQEANVFNKFNIASTKKVTELKLSKVSVDLLGNVHPAGG